MSSQDGSTAAFVGAAPLVREIRVHAVRQRKAFSTNTFERELLGKAWDSLARAALALDPQADRRSGARLVARDRNHIDAVGPDGRVLGQAKRTSHPDAEWIGWTVTAAGQSDADGQRLESVGQACVALVELAGER